MTVKNILSVSAFHSAIVSLDTAMKRFDPDVDNVTDNTFKIKDLLILLNMFNWGTDYTVTKLDGTKINVSYDQMKDATVTKSTENKYIFKHSGVSVEFKAIDVVI